MQLKIISFSAILLLGMASCSKDIPMSELNFEVTTINNKLETTTNFKIGDTINFKFSGNPDRITFFSGEIGNRYEFKDRVSDTSSNVVFNFLSSINTSGASGTMKLLVSTDFAGYKQNNAVDSLAVNKAMWADISSRAIWATNATATASGNINLADYATQKKPIYMAFRYEAMAATTQSRWTLNGFSIRHTIADTSYLINSTNLIVPTVFPAWSASQGWGTINSINPLIKFVLFSGAAATTASASLSATTSFGITGATVASSAVATENWLVAGPLDLFKVLPDAGLSIKDMSENAMNISKGFYTSFIGNYTYRFTTRGTYNVVFLASNDTRYGQKTVAKTIKIVVN